MAGNALAQASTPRVVGVVGSVEACPSPSDVRTLLARLLPGRDVRLGAEDGDAVRVELIDEGFRSRVSLPGSERVFVDPQRRCAERARMAAVFVALILSARPPPSNEMPTEQAPDGETPFAAVRRPKASVDRLALGSNLDVVGQLDAASASGVQESLVAGGGTVRIDLGVRLRRWFVGMALSAGGRSPMQLRLATAVARLDRVPADLDLRATVRLSRVEIGADVGLSVATLVVAGEDLPEIQQSTRIEIGVRLAALLRIWITSWLGATLGVETVIVPAPYDLSVAPRGVVGRLPTAWVSGFMGLAVKIH
jgi:hypothetical protein